MNRGETRLFAGYDKPIHLSANEFNEIKFSDEECKRLEGIVTDMYNVFVLVAGKGMSSKDADGSGSLTFIDVKCLLSECEYIFQCIDNLPERESSWRDSLDSINKFALEHAKDADFLDSRPMFWCGVELSILEKFAKQADTEVKGLGLWMYLFERILGVSQTVGYKAVLSIPALRDLNSNGELFSKVLRALHGVFFCDRILCDLLQVALTNEYAKNYLAAKEYVPESDVERVAQLCSEAISGELSASCYENLDALFDIVDSAVMLAKEAEFIFTFGSPFWEAKARRVDSDEDFSLKDIEVKDRLSLLFHGCGMDVKKLPFRDAPFRYDDLKYITAEAVLKGVLEGISAEQSKIDVYMSGFIMTILDLKLNYKSIMDDKKDDSDVAEWVVQNLFGYSREHRPTRTDYACNLEVPR